MPWSFEVLAVERGEVDAVGLVGDQEVEHRPDAGSPGHLHEPAEV